MVHTFEERYVDAAISTDERIGQLEVNTGDQTVKWSVNGEKRFTLTWEEFNSLLECAKKSMSHEEKLH